MTDARDERPRRIPVFAPLVSGGLGLFFLAIGFNRPSIADMRTLDLIHLLATGSLLGIALVTLVQYLAGRRVG